MDNQSIRQGFRWILSICGVLALCYYCLRMLGNCPPDWTGLACGPGISDDFPVGLWRFIKLFTLIASICALIVSLIQLGEFEALQHLHDPRPETTVETVLEVAANHPDVDHDEQSAQFDLGLFIENLTREWKPPAPPSQSSRKQRPH